MNQRWILVNILGWILVSILLSILESIVVSILVSSPLFGEATR